MTQNSNKPIVVAGGGIGGLTRRSGWSALRQWACPQAKSHNGKCGRSVFDAHWPLAK